MAQGTVIRPSGAPGHVPFSLRSSNARWYGDTRRANRERLSSVMRVRLDLPAQCPPTVDDRARGAMTGPGPYNISFGRSRTSVMIRIAVAAVAVTGCLTPADGWAQGANTGAGG